jgi:hypothetical protein
MSDGSFSKIGVRLYGEWSKYPIEIFIKSWMIGLWKSLICNKQDKISDMLYKLLFTMHQWDIFHSKWICCIENILNDCGYSEYWIAQNVTKNVLFVKKF